VIGIACDAAAWLATDMLPAPQVVEQAILDMEDQDAREAGEAAIACADYFSAIAQMYQHDVRDPVDAPWSSRSRTRPSWLPHHGRATWCRSGSTSSRRWRVGTQ
jgi:hypothetical protein